MYPHLLQANFRYFVCSSWFKPYLVANPEYRFLHDEANKFEQSPIQSVQIYLIQIFICRRPIKCILKLILSAPDASLLKS